jgi:hypothetical protein
MDWSRWLPLTERCGHWEPATYQIRLLSGDAPVVINRLLGADNDGILSIGKTKNMEGRRKQFATALAKCYGHSEGNLLYLLMNYSRLKTVIRNPAVEYRFTKRESDEAAIAHEAALLRAYIVQHGELPPLNSILPDRYGERTPWERSG